MYACIGQFKGLSFLSVELVSGSVVVSASFGGVAVKRTLSSRLGLMSDGEWHTVTMEMDRHVCNTYVLCFYFGIKSRNHTLKLQLAVCTILLIV